MFSSVTKNTASQLQQLLTIDGESKYLTVSHSEDSVIQ